MSVEYINKKDITPSEQKNDTIVWNDGFERNAAENIESYCDCVYDWEKCDFETTVVMDGEEFSTNVFYEWVEEIYDSRLVPYPSCIVADIFVTEDDFVEVDCSYFEEDKFKKACINSHDKHQTGKIIIHHHDGVKELLNEKKVENFKEKFIDAYSRNHQILIKKEHLEEGKIVFDYAVLEYEGIYFKYLGGYDIVPESEYEIIKLILENDYFVSWSSIFRYDDYKEFADIAIELVNPIT